MIIYALFYCKLKVKFCFLTTYIDKYYIGSSDGALWYPADIPPQNDETFVHAKGRRSQEHYALHW